MLDVGMAMGELQLEEEEIGKVSIDVDECRVKRGQQIDEIRMRLLDVKYRICYSRGLDMSRRTFSPDTYDNNVLKQLQEFSMLFSEADNLQLYATTQIEQLLSIERECPATLTRFEVVRRFVSFLTRDDFLELQYVAAWVLVKIAYGTCAETSKAEFAREVVPSFVRLLYSPHDDLCELAVLALGTVSFDSVYFDSPMDRDVFLINEALLPLLKLLEKAEKHAKLSMLRNATWTLSNLLYVRFEECHVEQHVKPLLSTFGCLLGSDDAEVLINSCWVIFDLANISHVYVEAVMDAGLCPKLVKLLIHTSRRVQIPVLMIADRLSIRHENIQSLIDNGALQNLRTLLTEDAKDDDPKDADIYIKREACRVTRCILCGNEGELQEVIKADLFGPLLKLLESPHMILQEAAAEALSKVTRTEQNETIIEYLVNECKMLKHVSNLLSSPNPTTVVFGLEILDNLLDLGFLKQQLLGVSNPYPVLIAEAGCVEKMERIMEEGWDDESVERAYFILEHLGTCL